MGTKGNRWALLLMLGMLLAGCWDRREVEERSNSLASGVDVCSEGQGCREMVTRQIAIPGRIPLGGGAEGGTGAADTVVVITSPGKDTLDAYGKAQAELNRKLNFGHTRVLVWSEEFARRGLEEHLNYVRRVPETRRHMWVAVSEGRAEDVIRARPSLEVVPALFLNNMFENAVRTGRLPGGGVFGDFLTRLSNKGEDAAIPLIRMAGPDQPELIGLAIFRGYRMVGKLTPEELGTFMELRGRQRGSEILKINLPEGHSADVTIRGRGTKYQIRWLKGRIQATVKLEMEGELTQVSPELVSSDPELISLIEIRAAEEVTRRAKALMQKLQQEFQADVLAVGERVRAHLPGAWKSIDDWPTAFANAQFSFDVTLRVRRTGMARD